MNDDQWAALEPFVSTRDKIAAAINELGADDPKATPRDKIDREYEVGALTAKLQVAEMQLSEMKLKVLGEREKLDVASVEVAADRAQAVSLAPESLAS